MFQNLVLFSLRCFLAVIAVTPVLAWAQAGENALRAAQPAAPLQEAPPDSPLLRQQVTLFTSIVKNNVAAVRELLRGGLDPNFGFDEAYPGRVLDTPLCMAIGLDRLEIARILIESGADPNRLNKMGHAPIHRAKSGEAIELLVKSGANINIRNTYGETALFVTAVRGDFAVFDRLAGAGARTDASNIDVFERVLQSRKPEFIVPLLARGFDPRNPPTKVMWELINEGAVEPARALLAKGVDPNASDARGTLLTHALFRKRWEIALALADAGASLHPADAPNCLSRNFTCRSILPAMLAAYDAGTLAALKARGLKLDHAARDGHTALSVILVDEPMRVMAVGGKSSIPPSDNVLRLENLINAGADVNRKVGDLTPLMVAVASPGRSPEHALKLVERGGRIEFDGKIAASDYASPQNVVALEKQADAALDRITPNALGELTGMQVGPVGWAVLAGRGDVAQRLIERVKRLERADRNLAYFAARMGQWDVLLAAINLQADPNAADRADVTPLHFAADAGRNDAVRRLLAAGARINSRSTRNWPPLTEGGIAGLIGGHPPSRPRLAQGYTALGAAKAAGHAETVRILAEAGGRE